MTINISSIDPIGEQNNPSTLDLPASPAAKSREIDVGEVAFKALASLALALTNSVLSVSILAMKLTQFTLVPTLTMGWLTNLLHKYNTALAQHAYTPFKTWARALGSENTRMIETEKVLDILHGRLKFYPENYKKQALDSLRLAMAPVSAALHAITAVAMIAVKPLWLAFFVPGFLADCIIPLPLCYLNDQVARLTYSPLQKSAYKMLGLQVWIVEEGVGFLGGQRTVYHGSPYGS